MKKLVKLFLFISIFNFSYAKDNNCSPHSFLHDLASSDSAWETLRNGSEFKPILRLAVIDSIFWLSTYGADGFPVEIKIIQSKALIKGITFRKESPKSDDNIKLLRQYRSENVIFELELPNGPCQLDSKLLIKISNVKTDKIETIELERQID